MTTRSLVGTVPTIVVFGAALLTPTLAAAQAATNATIAGVARDSTGSVLPGVTVEVESPALIEKIRSALTDNQGSYRIVSLPPGTYTVTFTLSGFRTFRREGIELTTGFTAPVNAELSIGDLTETVTVAAASPVVDVQNTRSVNVIRQELLQALPTNQSLQGFATLTVGVQSATVDVGGNQHERDTLTFAGRPPQKLLQDGVLINNLGGNGDGQFGSYSVNVQAMQEVALELGSTSAENRWGGVAINYIPREGSNRFSGLVDLAYGDRNLQWSNLNDQMRSRFVTTSAEAKALWDYAVTFGGPVQPDRLWFFGAARYFGGQEFQATNFYNKLDDVYLGSPSSGVVAYEADTSRRAFTDNHFADVTGRLTFQVTQKHKLSWGYSFQKSCVCNLQVAQNVAPEAVANANFNPIHLTTLNWTYPASNRLLFEAVGSYFHDNNEQLPAAETTARDIAITELVGTNTVRAGYRYNAAKVSALPAALDYNSRSTFKQAQVRASVSHVTGTNSLKAGLQYLRGDEERVSDYGELPVAYFFARGLPSQIRQFAAPHLNRDYMTEVGLFIQDQLTFRRLTLNVGVRYDYFGGSIPAQTRPAGPFVAAFQVAEIGSDALPQFHTVVPRLGAAYDLFGDGRTALKVSMGKYVASVGSNTIARFHPALTISTVADRAWNDANGNFVPDCVLTNPAGNGECGAMNNVNFGRSVPTIRTDEALKTADARGINWQALVAVQQQIRSGWGVEVAYDRTWYDNFEVTDNLLVTPADYDPFCVTAPSNPRLPNGGGYQICGLYDLKPAGFGRVDNFVTLQKNFGDRSQVYNGVRINTSGRFGRGAMVGGGFNIGRTWEENCAIVDSPQQQLYCDAGRPWGSTVQFKLNGTYPLPWGLQTSAAFRVVEGAIVDATQTYANAQIAPSLGRDLSACRGAAVCTATVTVPLYPQGKTLFEPRLVMLDWRLSKLVRVGGMRVQGLIDFFNLLNENAALSVSNAYDARWPRPTSTPPGRTIRLGAKVNW